MLALFFLGRLECFTKHCCCFFFQVDFLANVRDESWDRIEIQLLQTFQPKAQLGLTFMDVFAAKTYNTNDVRQSGKSVESPKESSAACASPSGRDEWKRKMLKNMSKS